MPETRAAPANDSSRNVYVFGATSLLNDTASEMAYWVLPAFLASIGAGPEKLGIIEGIAESVTSFAKLVSGYLADRLAQRKAVLVSGYVVANAVKPLLALATSWWHVLFIRFADRLAKGILGAPRDVMLTESVPKRHVGSAFGLIQAMDSAGAIVGPLLALWLLARYSMRGVFWAAALPGGLSILVAVLGIRETRTEASERMSGTAGSAPRVSLWRAHFPATFYYVLFCVTLFSLGNSSDMFLVLRAENLGILPSHAPLLGLFFNVTYTLLSWPAGKLSDRMSKRVLAAAGYFVFAIVYFVFASGPSLKVIWVAMASYGLFYALTNPVLRALVASTVPAEVRGRAFGAYYFATSVAALLASVLAGELWKHYGAAVPFYFSSAVAAVSAVLLLASRYAPAPR